MDLREFVPNNGSRRPNILVVSEDLGFEANNDLLSSLELQVSRQFRRVFTRAAHLPSLTDEESKLVRIPAMPSILTAQRKLEQVEFLIIHVNCSVVGFDALLMLNRMRLNFYIGMLNVDKNQATLVWYPHSLLTGR